MSEQVEAIERELEQARYGIEKAGAKAGTKAEKRYGSAYQQLVRLGARPQLRAKYRIA